LNSQKKKTAVLIRTSKEPGEVRGTFLIFENDDVIFSCKILELPDKGNQKKVSCIPIGIYKLVPRSSQSKGDHLEIQGVPGRSLCLIHIANYTRELEGCQAPGCRFLDLDGDGQLDIGDSRIALQRIVSIITEPITYMVIETKQEGTNEKL